jgi:multidrug efflux system outer membrane protein
MKRLSALSVTLGLMALGGCVVGPKYAAPTTDTPASYAGQGLVAQATSENADLSRWWAQFNDTVLDSLITRALAQNLDLKTAQSRIREARTQVDAAHAAELPTVSASALGARLDSQRPSSNSGSGGGFAIPSQLDLYSLGANASWQVDLFGGQRRAAQSAAAKVEAADWQARDTQVTLTGEVARAYLTLRLAQLQKIQAQVEIARLEDLLDLVVARQHAGLVSDLDVNQQRQALQAQQAELPTFDARARNSVHALGLLLAQNPDSLSAELAAPLQTLPPMPPALPVGLPSELLKRRPDIRAAERQMASASADIGVAQADLYPKLNLIGLASFAGTDLGNLLATRNFTTIGAGSGSWSLFDAGRTRATIRARREAAQQADITWRKTILTALREVEDALSSYASDSDREARLTETRAVAADTADLALQRYRSGLTAFIDVQQARASLISLDNQLLAARAARIGDLVALYGALGGGWS